jgi:hypothetical protein
MVFKSAMKLVTFVWPFLHPGAGGELWILLCGRPWNGVTTSRMLLGENCLGQCPAFPEILQRFVPDPKSKRTVG